MYWFLGIAKLQSMIEIRSNRGAYHVTITPPYRSREAAHDVQLGAKRPALITGKVRS